MYLRQILDFSLTARLWSNWIFMDCVFHRFFYTCSILWFTVLHSPIFLILL